MIKNNQDYRSILILIMVQKNPTENPINFSTGLYQWIHVEGYPTKY